MLRGSIRRSRRRPRTEGARGGGPSRAVAVGPGARGVRDPLADRGPDRRCRRGGRRISRTPSSDSCSGSSSVSRPRSSSCISSGGAERDRGRGLDTDRPARAIARGALRFVVVGSPASVCTSRPRIGVNRFVVPTPPLGHWWTVPALVLNAVEAGVVEEVSAWLPGHEASAALVVAPPAIGASAVLRGSYHLYQVSAASWGTSPWAPVRVPLPSWADAPGRSWSPTPCSTSAGVASSSSASPCPASDPGPVARFGRGEYHVCRDSFPKRPIPRHASRGFVFSGPSRDTSSGSPGRGFAFLVPAR